MALAFPSRVGDQFNASFESESNFNQLLRVDARGSEEQVATRVALQHFRRIQELRPGYFDGLKSWAKSGCVYVGAGAATLGTIALTAYGVYQIATQTNYGLHLLAGTSTAGWISSEMGYAPINNLSALVIATVRDSANRAAKSSIKADERSLEAKEREAKECHEQIIKQLTAVFDDAAKYLRESCQKVEISAKGEDRIALRKMANLLSDQIGPIEILLSKLHLKKNETEAILQRLKDTVRSVQAESCKLGSSRSDGKRNAELIAGWPLGSVGEIAVPFGIRDRIESANRARMGTVEKAQGYCKAFLSMIPASAISGFAVTAIWIGWNSYANGSADTVQKARDFFSNLKWEPSSWLDLQSMTKAQGIALCAIALPTAAVGIKKGLDHSRMIEANAAYVQEKRETATKELLEIYEGIGRHVASDKVLAQQIRQRAPEMREEFRKLGIGTDLNAILGF